VIVSASRRTDIPAFYSEWFVNRLRAGWCQVVNPFNPSQVRTVSLQPGDVDALVLWTRDPAPFHTAIDEVEARSMPYVVLITLTGYGPLLEPHAPSAAHTVEQIRRLADRIGPRRVTWRYDPIVLGPGHELEDHLERFGRLSAALSGAVDRVVISGLDLYAKTRRRLAVLPHGETLACDPRQHPSWVPLIRGLAERAADASMELVSCAEPDDLTPLGAPPAGCLDGLRLREITGTPIPLTKDPGQRPACRCVASRDIGAPDTCLHGCAYCYATRSHGTATRRHARHDPSAPALMPMAARSQAP
jgi:hypothetical protein